MCGDHGGLEGPQTLGSLLRLEEGLMSPVDKSADTLQKRALKEGLEGLTCVCMQHKRGWQGIQIGYSLQPEEGLGFPLHD